MKGDTPDSPQALEAALFAGWGQPFTGASLAHVVQPDDAWALFDAMVTSRLLDFAALALREQGVGFYTIGSSGHESNAYVAWALRVTDPAFLHYRSGAFFCARAAQAAYAHAARDVLLGVAAARAEPIAGGRHKVFGSVPLNIPPQTSTIASHVPKAVGMAFHMKAAVHGQTTTLPGDSVVVCSFGDASFNHATAQGALGTAAYLTHRKFPVPLLVVCEDNGLGISVPTPPDWIATAMRGRAGWHVLTADGCDPQGALEVAREAVAHVRKRRRPVFLHLRTVRLMGHAGSDVALAYRRPEDIRDDIARDPIAALGRAMVHAGFATVDELVLRYRAHASEVTARAHEAAIAPKLTHADDVMRPLSPRRMKRVASEVRRSVVESQRRAFWGDALPESAPPMTMAMQLNRAIGDGLVKYPQLLVFGEDVAKKGGVYGVTRGLTKRAGTTRVFDTLLDEQSIFGFAMGAGQLGMLAMPEIQYLAYLHTAEDQLRGEAASLQFFSNDQLRNPMVVRIAGLAYQKGFGGHFHNDNGLAVLRDIPGIVVAIPSSPAEAAALLRTCLAAAAIDGTVCVLVEPIALYNVKDLHEDGDGAFLEAYNPHAPPVAIGEPRWWRDGEDLTLVAFGNGCFMARRVAEKLLRTHNVTCTVLDIRFVQPLPELEILRAAKRSGRVVIVDETRRSAGVGEGIVTALIEHGFDGAIARVSAKDTFIPLGDAANLVLVQEAEIERVAREMLGI